MIAAKSPRVELTVVFEWAGRWSEPSFRIVTSTAVPEPPISVRIESTGSAYMAKACWRRPGCDGGSAVLAYDVQYKGDASASADGVDGGWRRGQCLEVVQNVEMSLWDMWQDAMEV